MCSPPTSYVYVSSFSRLFSEASLFIYFFFISVDFLSRQLKETDSGDNFKKKKIGRGYIFTTKKRLKVAAACHLNDFSYFYSLRPPYSLFDEFTWYIENRHRSVSIWIGHNTKTNQAMRSFKINIRYLRFFQIILGLLKVFRLLIRIVVLID